MNLTDALTQEQMDIAATVVRLAERAVAIRFRIHACAMAPKDWQSLADAYGMVSDRAEAQLRTADEHP